MSDIFRGRRPCNPMLSSHGSDILFAMQLSLEAGLPRNPVECTMCILGIPSLGKRTVRMTWSDGYRSWDEQLLSFQWTSDYQIVPFREFHHPKLLQYTEEHIKGIWLPSTHPRRFQSWNSEVNLLTICSNILTSLLHPFTSSMWQNWSCFMYPSWYRTTKSWIRWKGRRRCR